jgi:hypothetical protein
MANADDPAAAQLGAQADAMIMSGSHGATYGNASAAPVNGSPSTVVATGSAGARAGPGAPLRFVQDIGLQPRAGDRVNPTCYSNVITRPGPPGWGQRGSLPPGSGQQARAAVESLRSSFIAACRAASGRDVTSAGNFHWTWNETQDGESQIANSRAQYPGDVTVNL